MDILEKAKNVLNMEASAILEQEKYLDASFVKAVNLILNCKGRVVVTGIGKSGIIAQKISATLASTGTPSLFLHPIEALHGDLGRLCRGDLLLALSNSGETAEILQLLNPVKRLNVDIISLTKSEHSSLGKASCLVISMVDVPEACPIGLAPTTSTSVMLALGDALAMCVLNLRAFGPQDFALFHPAGSLGKKLMKIEDIMRKEDANPMVNLNSSILEALQVMTETKGRPGATSVVDEHQSLWGFFTDGDFRRLVTQGFVDFSCSIERVMTRSPKSIHPDTFIGEALRILEQYRIDQLPVVDEENKVVGFFDIQDYLGLP